MKENLEAADARSGKWSLRWPEFLTMTEILWSRWQKRISLDLLKEYDEKNTGSFLYNIALFASYNQGGNQSKIYELYYEVQKAIKDLAKSGPAVFVGRCSTEILKEDSKAVSV